jgi:hypothetical protein
LSYWIVGRWLPGIAVSATWMPFWALALFLVHRSLKGHITRTTDRQTATLTGSPGALSPAPDPTPMEARPMTLFEHVPHPHILQRKKDGPVTVAGQLPLKHKSRYVRVNARIAVAITAAVGSMTCAWIFCLLAIAGLPTALKPGNIGFLFWFSSDLLQLTLLSVIIVGQNLQAAASDKRAEQTYLDGEASLQGLGQQAQHLAAQDDKILAILAAIEANTALTEQARDAIRAAVATPQHPEGEAA